MQKMNGTPCAEVNDLRTEVLAAWAAPRLLSQDDFPFLSPFDDVEWLIGVNLIEIEEARDEFFTEDPFSIISPYAALELLGLYFLALLEVFDSKKLVVPAELGIPVFSVLDFLSTHLTTEILRGLTMRRLRVTHAIIHRIISSPIKRIDRKSLQDVIARIDNLLVS